MKEDKIPSKWHARQIANEMMKAVIWIAIGYVIAIGLYL